MTDTLKKLALEELNNSQRNKKLKANVKSIKKNVQFSETQSEDEAMANKIVKNSSSEFNKFYSSSDESFDKSRCWGLCFNPICTVEKTCVLCRSKIDARGEEKAFLVNFFRRKPTINSEKVKFCNPIVKDCYEVCQDKVIMKLPSPKINKETTRTAKTLQFSINFKLYKTNLG